MFAHLRWSERSSIHLLLVGGLEHVFYFSISFMTFQMLRISSSQLTPSFFRGLGGSTTNQLLTSYNNYWYIVRITMMMMMMMMMMTTTTTTMTMMMMMIIIIIYDDDYYYCYYYPYIPKKTFSKLTFPATFSFGFPLLR